MSVNLQLNDETMVEAFRAAVLQSLTPETQKDIIGRAVEEILKKRDNSTYGRNWLVDNAMQGALRENVQIVFDQFFKRPEVQQKLREAAELVAQRIVDKIGADLADKSADAFLTALADQYRR
jgi:hypothetical protein